MVSMYCVDTCLIGLDSPLRVPFGRETDTPTYQAKAARYQLTKTLQAVKIVDIHVAEFFFRGLKPTDDILIKGLEIDC